MIPINSTFAPLQAFVEELARCGMRHAVTSPGSRNAPLALTLAAQDGIEAVSVIDERCAGFVALGMAKASGLPVAVTCTSGTAAANFHPAVAEARESRVPLIVLTADRPPELRDVGAGQAIDQLGIYGSAAKWFVEVGNHEPSRATAVHYRALACRAWATAAGGRPGVVQLNFGLREPLAPVAEELDADEWQGRADGRPWVDVREAPRTARPEDLAEVTERLRGARRGAIVCGAASSLAAQEAFVGAARLAAALDWPLLAEPTSGLRFGPHDRSHVVAHYDVLLRSKRFADGHVPEVVLRVGDTPTSKPLRAWLARTPQIVLDPDGAWHEPTRAAELLLQADPAPALTALVEALGSRGDAPDGSELANADTAHEADRTDTAHEADRAGRDDSERAAAAGADADRSWLRAWREADALVPPALAAAADPCEPKALAAIEPGLDEDALVWVSSSMAIRHVETFFPTSSKRLRMLANRGANGIDGVISSAAGASLATGRLVTVLIGELALLHDVGGLLAAQRAGARLAIVCVNNGGGAIFDLLPVAGIADPTAYEHHIATPTELDLQQVAALAGMGHVVATTPEQLRAELRERTLIEVSAQRPFDQSTLLAPVLERLDHG
jgi:2-succinyl-5-enolpyruvyl-6-hydroxy-3-cyclohexene-1-carboxylate synthase